MLAPKRKQYKRKRGPFGGGGTYKAGPSAKRFRPGYTRTAGYYGRYAGKNAELKYKDTEVDVAALVPGGTIVQSINLIQPGSGESERIGRKCTVRSLHWRYQLSLLGQQNVAGFEPGDTVRIIIFVDKQANGAAATAAQLLATTGSLMHAWRNLENSQRFTILMDRIHNLEYGAGAGTGAANSISGVHKTFTFHKACTIPLEFGPTDPTTIADVRSNNIGMLMFGNQSQVVLNSTVRVRYSDQ